MRLTSEGTAHTHVVAVHAAPTDATCWSTRKRSQIQRVRRLEWVRQAASHARLQSSDRHLEGVSQRQRLSLRAQMAPHGADRVAQQEHDKNQRLEVLVDMACFDSNEAHERKARHKDHQSRPLAQHKSFPVEVIA
eukprot:38675-Pleurochrysis_carterae.AAC.4